MYNKKQAGSDPKIAALIGRVLTVFVCMIYVVLKKSKSRKYKKILSYKGASNYYSLVSPIQFKKSKIYMYDLIHIYVCMIIV